VLGILGESGSGKSTIAKALLGMADDVLVEGTMALGGLDLGGLSEKQWNEVRWRRIALAFQSPASLNPVLRVGLQLTEPLQLHMGMRRHEAERRAAELLEEVSLGDWALDRYPSELSGGQRRLVLLALALACEPELLLLDEPTAGLDGVTRTKVEALLRGIRNAGRRAMVIFGHDIDTSYRTGHGIRRDPFVAVDGIDVRARAGEVVGIVGGTGAGKSTLAMMALRVQEPDGGTVLLEGTDLLAARGAELKTLRGRTAFLFQDPFEALSPRFTVPRAVREPLDVQGAGTNAERDTKVAEMLHAVHLPTDPAFLGRHTHELSGGQLQRVALARRSRAGHRPRPGRRGGPRAGHPPGRSPSRHPCAARRRRRPRRRRGGGGSLLPRPPSEGAGHVWSIRGAIAPRIDQTPAGPVGRHGPRRRRRCALRRSRLDCVAW
jgi:peptide/nickel transport system ATP-binding protein